MLSFCAILWSRLSWPAPHCIIPIPSRVDFSGLAEEFAASLSCSLQERLKWRWEGPFEQKFHLVGQADSLFGRDLLLFDFATDGDLLRSAVGELAKLKPRSMHIFSIFEEPFE